MSDCLYTCLAEVSLERYHVALVSAGVRRCDQLADLSLSDYVPLGVATAADRLRLFKLVQLVRSVRADGGGGCQHGGSDVAACSNGGERTNGVGGCGGPNGVNGIGHPTNGVDVNRVNARANGRSRASNMNRVEYHAGSDSPVFRCRKVLDFSESDTDQEVAPPVREPSIVPVVPVAPPSTAKPPPRARPPETASAETHAYFPPPPAPPREPPVETIYHDAGYDYGLPNAAHVTPRSTERGDPLERIRVCVRKRPLLQRERNRKDVDAVRVVDSRTVSVSEDKVAVDLTKYIQKHVFQFDDVFDENCSNSQLYDKTVKSLVEKVVKKGCATCFAFGQTGAGKTHTLLGSRGVPGLYQMAARDMLAVLHSGGRSLKLWVSYYEIYCGQLFDLLNKRKRLQVRENGKQKVCIAGLMETNVPEVKRITQVVHYGNAARRTGSTGVNSTSSRSHAVLQLELRDLKDNRIGRISFIDLAGSERAADVTQFDRRTRIEGAEINQSLLALKECIRSIDQESRHTPYRQSKLTHILRDSFVGDSHTVMIANISPSQTACENTLNTLRYADRVKELRKNLPKARASQPGGATVGAKQASPRKPVLSLAAPFHPSNVPFSSTPKVRRLPTGGAGAEALRRVLSGDADSPISGHRLRRCHTEGSTGRWKAERDLAASGCAHRASPTTMLRGRVVLGQESHTSPTTARDAVRQQTPGGAGSDGAAMAGHRDVMAHLDSLLDRSAAVVPNSATGRAGGSAGQRKRFHGAALEGVGMRRVYASAENVSARLSPLSPDGVADALLTGRQLLESLSRWPRADVGGARQVIDRCGAASFHRASSCSSISGGITVAFESSLAASPPLHQGAAADQHTQSVIDGLDMAIQRLVSDSLANGDDRTKRTEDNVQPPNGHLTNGDHWTAVEPTQDIPGGAAEAETNGSDMTMDKSMTHTTSDVVNNNSLRNGITDKTTERKVDDVTTGPIEESASRLTNGLTDRLTGMTDVRQLGKVIEEESARLTEARHHDKEGPSAGGRGTEGATHETSRSATAAESDRSSEDVRLFLKSSEPFFASSFFTSSSALDFDKARVPTVRSEGDILAAIAALSPPRNDALSPAKSPLKEGAITALKQGATSPLKQGATSSPHVNVTPPALAASSPHCRRSSEGCGRFPSQGHLQNGGGGGGGGGGGATREFLPVHRVSAFSKVAADVGDGATDKPTGKAGGKLTAVAADGEATDSPVRTEKLGVVTVGATFAPIHRFPLTPGEKSGVISMPRAITKTVVAKPLFGLSPMTSAGGRQGEADASRNKRPIRDQTSCGAQFRHPPPGGRTVGNTVSDTAAIQDHGALQSVNGHGPSKNLTNSHKTAATRAVCRDSELTSSVGVVTSAGSHRNDSGGSRSSSGQSNMSALQRSQSLLVSEHEEELAEITALCRKEMRLLVAVKSGALDFDSYLEALQDLLSSKADSIDMLRSHIREYSNVSMSE